MPNYSKIRLGKVLLGYLMLKLLLFFCIKFKIFLGHGSQKLVQQEHRRFNFGMVADICIIFTFSLNSLPKVNLIILKLICNFLK